MNKAIIVGCGLVGSVIARRLADAGFQITILDRRSYIAGNLYDYRDKHGILLHKYGPHIFHTNNQDIYDFIKKYGDWNEYRMTCGVEIDGRITPSPFNFQTIDDFFCPEKADKIKSAFVAGFPNRSSITVIEALNSSNAYIREYARWLFQKDYRPYTVKQWGIQPEEIDQSVLMRVPLRLGYGEGYFDDIYQVVPDVSYVRFIENLLRHPSIHIELNVDARSKIRIEKNGSIYFQGMKVEYPVFYTGALDELYDGVFGNLPYRSIEFRWEHEEIESKQQYALVAYPEATGYTRIVEYNKIKKTDAVCGTTYGYEYPVQYQKKKGMEPYYPILTEESISTYKKYFSLAEKTRNLIPCGRLADFKYYNMDQAIERALQVSGVLLKE